MIRTNDVFAASTALSLALSGCAGTHDEPAQGEKLGTATLSLTRAPEDAQCLRVSIEGTERGLVRLLDLTPGQSSVFRLEGLPIGVATFEGEAFNVACKGVFENSIPSWYSEAVSAQIAVVRSVHVVLEMIRNGRATVGVDFDPANNPSVESPAEALPGVTSSHPSYLIPMAEGVEVKALLTVGDSINLKPDGTPYRMVGIPDGMGAYDNGDGTFSLLSNHELSNSRGITRAHGSNGTFVSRWIIRKSDMAVLKGEDLISQVVLWDRTTSAYGAPSAEVNMGRFCSADLPDHSAFYDAVSGLGFDGRLFLNGEETGAEGRGFAHGLDGTSYEVPRIGKLSFENAVANPGTGVKTVVVSLDDSGGGQVYVYAGTKTDSGSPVDKAGLTNGVLFGIAAVGHPIEDPAAGIATGPFVAENLGNVENWTGADLNRVSAERGVTGFQRPEDGAWDPSNPNDFYFVTTASFNGNSRLWRLRFVDAAKPELGGEIAMMLRGDEGHKQLDQVAIDRRGHIILQEDTGSNVHVARVFRYEIATGALTAILQHDPARFAPGGADFLTTNEEASGVIDASDFLGDGWFLMNVQAHYGQDAELVEGGQFQAVFDPGSL